MSSVDTSKIALGADLLEVVEAAARNIHDIWLAKRQAEGWSYGPRDDELKQNPNMVAYDELPEGEKDYDRAVATEAIKTLLAMGFRIEPTEKTRP